MDEVEVHRGPAEALQTAHQGGPNLGGAQVLPGELRNDQRLRRRRAGPVEHVAEDPLGAPRPVDLGGVEPPDPPFERVADRRLRPRLVLRAPATEGPESEAQWGMSPSGLAERESPFETGGRPRRRGLPPG